MPTVKIDKASESWNISPVGEQWESFFAAGPHVSEDFLNQRDQGEFEEREPL